MSSGQLEPWQSFASGSIAGMLGGMATHPIDLVKVRMQLYGSKDGFGYGSSHAAGLKKRPTMLMTARHVISNEGSTALYRGLSASLIRQATFIGTKFGVYDILKNALSDADGELSFLGKAVCGMTAGAVGAAIGNPADLAMVRMQADGRLPAHLRRNYRNGVDAIVRVVRDEGLWTLWRGCSPTVGRAIVITASQLAVYDHMKTVIQKASQLEGPMLHTSASIGASFVAAFTSNPFDVAKSRLQQMTVRSKDGKFPYSGTVDCLLKTSKNEGIGALYKGITPTVSRQLLLNMVRFVAFEQIKAAFLRANARAE